MNDVANELDELGGMTTNELCARYQQVFGQPVRTRHKAYLIRKIAWRVQALAEGDLSERARKRAAELANDADVRVMPPKAATLPPAADGGQRVAHIDAKGDPRLPAPGNAVVRTYKGRTIRVVVREDGFDYEGLRYKTLTLSIQDILIVAPYNMQVRRLKARLGNDARVGSVDKFQGQEALVVIVSMCASAAEDVPRGIEFILNKNRLNVAVSRAMCLAIVVGCRGLMAPRCTTIRQMEMANLYCWLAAHAETPAS